MCWLICSMLQMVWTDPAPGVLYQVRSLGAMRVASRLPMIAPTAANTPTVFRAARFTKEISWSRLTPRAGHEYASGTDGPRTSCHHVGHAERRVRDPDPDPRLPALVRHRCHGSFHSWLHGRVRLQPVRAPLERSDRNYMVGHSLTFCDHFRRRITTVGRRRDSTHIARQRA